MPDVDTSTASSILAGMSAGQPPVLPPPQMPQAAPAGMTLTAAPQPPISPAPQMDPIPQETQQHMGGIHRALNAVANLLGGPITYRMEPNPDGSMSIAPAPSTGGEKWGRIAANALGGLAAGLAVDQGPGGGAKAAAAGIQYGLQQPQKQLEGQEKQVDFQNEQLLATANRAHLQQQAILLGQQVKENGIKLDQEAADTLNKAAQFHSQNPKAIDFGVVSGDPHAIIDKINRDPRILAAHLGQSDINLHYVQEEDGKTHLYGTPKSEDEKLNAVSMPVVKFDMDTTDPAKPIPRLTSTMNNPGSDTVGSIHTSNEAETNKYFDSIVKKGQADKAEADANKPPVDPKTDPEMILSKYKLRYPNDPQRALTEATAEIHRNAMALKETGTGTGAGVGGITPQTQISDLIKPGAVFAPGTVNGTNAQKLADGSMVLNDLPKRMAKGVPTPQETAAAAEAYSQAMYGMPWSETNIQQEKKFFSDLKVQGATDGIDKMIGHDGQPGYLDKVLKLAKTANIGPSAPINQLTLWAKTHIGDQAAKDYVTALGEVQRTLPSLIGNPLLGGSDSDLKLKEAQKMFGSNPSLGNLVSTSQVLSDMLHGSVNSYASQNRYLQRRYGMQGPYAKQFGMPGTGGGTPTPTPPLAPTAPAGAAAPTTKDRSIAGAMALPFNKGKTADEVRQDLLKHGYNPVQ